MVKILHLVTIMNRAGQETFLMNIYRHMNRSAFQFGFLCTSEEKGDYDDEIERLGGEVLHIKLDKKKGKLRHIDNYRILKESFRKLSNCYDIVHIHNYHAFDLCIELLAAKKSYKNVIGHSHSTYADAHILMHKCFRILLSTINVKRLACSKEAGEWMYRKGDFEVVSNGIDIEKFIYSSSIRQKIRKELKLEDAFVIGHVGRFEKVKNHQLIIDTFAKYITINPKAVLMLVGRGSLYSKIVNYVEEKKLNKNVLFMGMREDVNELYQCMDVFFFPSVFEGLGIVAIEAQSADLVCLLSDAIPHEVDITDKIVRCGVDKPIEGWVEKLCKAQRISSEKTRTNNISKIRDAGFDVKESTKKLEKIYMDMMISEAE